MVAILIDFCMFDFNSNLEGFGFLARSMTGCDGFPVWADRRVSLGRTDLFDRMVAQREVHLFGGPARGFGRETGPRKQALGNPVVSLILLQAGKPSVR